MLGDLRENEAPVCWVEVHDVLRNRHWPCGKQAICQVTTFDAGGFVDTVQRMCSEHGKAVALAAAQIDVDVEVRSVG